MKIFLSGVESGTYARDWLIKKKIPMKWNLMSYFYIRGRKELAEEIRDHSEQVLIDSGAFSFQRGKKVDWETYTREYAKFIQEFDRENVLGFFEMDVDEIIGYEKVLELRKILEEVSDKIIPVWHKNRGIEEYKKMCQEYAGKIIAITGFKDRDIRDDQYLLFLKEAKKYGCKVHCLGMTRKAILDKVPFDFVDSTSWLQEMIFGRIAAKKVTSEFIKENKGIMFYENYLWGMKTQRHYYKKWRKVCKD